MENIKLTEGSVKHVSFVTLLGSQLSESGSIEDDLKFHMRHRYPAVTKFFNFLRNNKLAPTAVKLKVLQACVTSALLHNCEAFGDLIPADLERIYFSLIKSALGVRKSTANDLAGCLQPSKILHYPTFSNFSSITQLSYIFLYFYQNVLQYPPIWISSSH